jgi:hypothetical protein
MGLGQIHKQTFKMKPIYTNQPKKMLMQIGMVHEKIMRNPIHKIHHGLDLKRAYHSPLYNISCD